MKSIRAILNSYKPKMGNRYRKYGELDGEVFYSFWNLDENGSSLIEGLPRFLGIKGEDVRVIWGVDEGIDLMERIDKNKRQK